MPAMAALTRSQLLVGAAAVAVPGRSAPPPRWRRSPRRCAARSCCRALPRTRASPPSSTAATPGVRPAAVAQPLDARDLAAALRVARARDLSVRVRAGGHSYIGASTVAGGVVLDLRQLRGIQVLADGSVLAGAGLRQIELISALAPRGRAVVHGSCPTVGVAGFTLGRRLRLRCAPLRARLRHAASRPTSSTCARSSRPSPTPTCCRACAEPARASPRHLAAAAHALRSGT